MVEEVVINFAFKVISPSPSILVANLNYESAVRIKYVVGAEGTAVLSVA